jgi:hypothetical protein
MSLKKLTSSTLSTLLVSSFFAACTPPPELTQKQQEQLGSFNLSQVDSFAHKIDKAINTDELSFYAPVSMKNVKSYYDSAQKEEVKSAKYASFLAAQESLEHAYKTKELVKDYCAPIFVLQEKMDKLNTKQIFESDYSSFIDGFMDVIELIDEDEITSALNLKKEVLEEGNNLHSDAIVFRNMNRAKEILESMDDNDLNDEAPNHYEKANILYYETEKKIKKDPENMDLVNRLSTKAINAALFAQTISKNVLTIKSLDVDEYENYFAKIHQKISLLNPNEEKNSILPLSFSLKVESLKSYFELEKANILASVNEHKDDKVIIAVSEVNTSISNSLEDISDVNATPLVISSIEVNSTQENNQSIVIQSVPVQENNTSVVIKNSIEEDENNTTVISESLVLSISSKENNSTIIKKQNSEESNTTH